jgi:hypothetical protein
VASVKYLKYKPEDQRIPLEGYVLGAIVLFAVFGFLPLLHWMMK